MSPKSKGYQKPKPTNILILQMKKKAAEKKLHDLKMGYIKEPEIKAFYAEFQIFEESKVEKTGDVAEMVIVNEYDESYSVYVPGERSKIKLRALATDENGEEVWPGGTMQWVMEDGNGNKEISNQQNNRSC